MATIRKRGAYQWQAQIIKKGHPHQYKTFNNKADAEKWARQVEAEMDRGIFVSRKEAESTTLLEALERYQKEVSAKKKGSYQESRRIENLKLHPLAKRFLATIQGKDIANYRDFRLGSVTSATVRRELVILSHLFEVALKEWGMGGLLNPVKSIRLPSGRGEIRERRLTIEEEIKLLEASQEYGGDIHDIVVLALETGMRRGEIAGLTWTSINFQKKTAFLRHTKNSESRTVPLSERVISVLLERQRNQTLDGKIFGFVDPHSITRAFERSCKRSGIEDLRFHDLRHEATSRFFELGLSSEEVKKITGHKTYAMLARYTHLRAEDIADKLDRLKKLKEEDRAERLR